MTIKLVNRSIIDLINNTEYCHIGAIMQCMNINVTEQVSTAGVMYDKKTKKFKMLVNSDYMLSITDKERGAVMVHEIDHILHKHLFMDIKKEDMRTWNVAMDLVINQGNLHLPKVALTLEMFKDEDGNPFESNKPTEYYYNKLVKEDSEIKIPSPQQGEGESQEANGEQGNSESQDDQESKEEWKNFKDWMKEREGEQVTLDSHDWEESLGEDEKEKLEAMKDLLRNARKRVDAYSRGNRAIEDYLQDIDKQVSALDFREVLKTAVRRTMPAKDYARTFSRPNRRLGYKAAGKRTELLPKIDFLLDTSGSIDMDLMNLYIEVIKGFLGLVSKAELHLFHTSTYKTFTINSGFKLDNGVIECGGTDLTDSLQKLIDKGSDLAIVLTDGYYGMPDVNIAKLPKMAFVVDKTGDLEHPLSYKYKTYTYEGA